MLSVNFTPHFQMISLTQLIWVALIILWILMKNVLMSYTDNQV